MPLLLGWLRCASALLVVVGIEGTGVYGAGLAQYLRGAGVELVEVDRPDRKARRWQGKSDPVDAEAAARAALAGRATGTPKTARRRRSRRCAPCASRAAPRSPPAPMPRRQMKALIVTAPDPLRSRCVTWVTAS